MFWCSVNDDPGNVKGDRKTLAYSIDIGDNNPEKTRCVTVKGYNDDGSGCTQAV